jgi:hypothetical protein
MVQEAGEEEGRAEERVKGGSGREREEIKGPEGRK